MITELFLALSAIVFIAWWLRRRRIRDAVRGRRPVVSDELLRDLLDGGPQGPNDDALDEDEIREAEDRFWEEADWDDPEEFHP